MSQGVPPRDENSPLDDITARDILSDVGHLDFPYPIAAEPGWDSPHDPSELLRLEVATYIGHMSAELGRMASNSELTLLSYFLQMAAAEARESANRLGLQMHAATPLTNSDPGQTLT